MGIFCDKQRREVVNGVKWSFVRCPPGHSSCTIVILDITKSSNSDFPPKVKGV